VLRHSKQRWSTQDGPTDVIAEAIEAYRLERQRLSREHAKARGFRDHST
jgi:hypothetical protein